MFKRLLVIFLFALVLGAILIFSQHRRVPLHVSGFIEAHEVRVGSRVGGRVAQVKAIEGANVHGGDVLLQLEPYDLLERQAEARAQVAAKKADVDRLTTGLRPEETAAAQARRDQAAGRLEELVNGPRKQEISTAEARLTLAKAQLQLAQSNYDRVKAGFERAVSSRDEMDRATDNLRVAEANLIVSQHELDLLNEGTRKEEITQAKARLAEIDQDLALAKKGFRDEEIAAGKAALQAANASLDAIGRQIEELTVHCPVDGTIEAVELRPGDLIAANAPALTVLDNSELWVRAYVPENHLDLRDGQKVRVTVDSLSNKFFAGHISFIARQAEFTPGNVQTPEERSKQVFRIKVILDEREGLRPGMSADVWLEDRP